LIEQKKERRKREGGRDIREIWLLTYIHRPIKNKAERERERERERNLSGRRAFRKYPCLKGSDLERTRTVLLLCLRAKGYV
jgi:hypothetical protein